MSARLNEAAVAGALATLADLDLEALRAELRRRHRAPPPAALKRDLLMRGIAHRIETDAAGDLDRMVATLLSELASAADPAAVLARRRTRRIKPGCELLREWNGTTHRVVVLKRGFAWNGEIYPSLSMVARAITGTRWNGYRFFGTNRGDAAGNGAPKGSTRSGGSRSGCPAGRARL